MTGGIIFITIPYSTIYYSVYQEFLTVWISLLYQLLFSLTVLIVNILFIGKLFLYFLIPQVLHITSAITPVSAIAQFYLFVFTVSVTYQNLLLLPLQYSYQIGFPISYPYPTLLSPQSMYQQLLQGTSVIYLHEVTVPCTCVKSLVTLWHQLLLSLTEICFPNKILVSIILISYSSLTTKFHYT